jgi:hypothetical protein
MRAYLLGATGAVLIGHGCVGPGNLPATPGDMTVVVVSGILDPAGNELTALQPPKRLVVPRAPLPTQSGGRYVLEVTYETGDRLDLSFTGLVADDAGHTQYGFFEIYVPADQQVQTMTIFDTRAARALATLQESDIVD